jgi:uncharacterized protein (TIGR03067 family)
VPATPSRVQDVFLAAADLLDAAARAAFLDRACGGDADLRARVEALLKAHGQPDSLLDVPIHPPGGAETRTAEPTPGEPADGTATRTYGSGERTSDDDLAVLTPSDRPGSLGRIGHYEVLEVLGRGGFGTVYRAFDDKLQRVVAVKVLAPQLATTSPARKRFLREARATAAIQHDHVVQIYDTQEQPLPYLVMEFIPGETLQQKLDRTGPLEVPEVLRIGRQIAEGLAAAHEKGLVHRDVKPANVLIDGGPTQRVKLTDFGLARAADDASISHSGVVAGTPMYMAPEQAKGDTLDHRADLFSLGSVLYAISTGRPPFRASSMMAVLKRVVEEDPRPMRDVIPEVPEWLCRIVGKLHAKDPAARYESARDVADVLADCEQQVATHGALKDFAKIPGGGKPVPKCNTRRVAAALCGIAALFWAAILFAEPAYRYATNQAAISTTPEAGWTSFVVWRDGHAVTDWYDARTRPTVTLPPGKYKLDPTFAPGRTVERWEIRIRSTFSSRTEWQGDRAPEFEVRRGEEATVRAVMRDEPVSGSGPAEKPIATLSPAAAQLVLLHSEKENVTGPWRVRLGVKDMGGGVGQHSLDLDTGPVGPDDYTFESGGIGFVVAKSQVEKLRGTTIDYHLGEAARGFVVYNPNFPEVCDVLSEIAPSTPRGFVPVFDGKDLTGFLPDPAGVWRVENGELVGRADRFATLHSAADTYRDFHLRAEIKIEKGGAAVGFRARSDKPPVRYMATIDGQGPNPAPTGSLAYYSGEGQDFTILTRARQSSPPPGTWFRLEVIAKGPKLTTLVNGTPAAEFTDDRLDRGRLALILRSPAGGTIQVHKFEVKELPPAGASTDHDQLQGTWIALNGENHGEPLQPDALKRLKIVFTGDRFRITKLNGHDDEGPFTIDPAKDPKTLDFHFEESIKGAIFAQKGVMPGIYRLEGDRLTLCIADFDQPRPDRFESAAASKRNELVVVLRRARPDEELPASSPAVPKTAAEVLPFLVGGWKLEREIVEPKEAPDLVHATGHATFDYVCGGKFLRGRLTFDRGLRDILVIHSFDPKIGRPFSWFWAFDGQANGPGIGVFDAEKHTLLWLDRLPNDSQSVQQFEFADAGTVRSRVYQQNANGKIAFEMRSTFSRTRDQIAPATVPVAPDRPQEMKVLDRLTGNWRAEVTVMGADKTETVRTTAAAILGGRFVEVIDDNETTKSSDYAIAWFDAEAKRYRQWAFDSRGTATELRGTWAAATNTLTWASEDGRREGRWVFKSEDAVEIRARVKDPEGRVLRDETGTSRRVPPAAPDAAVVKALQDAVAAKERMRDTVKVQVEAQSASALALAAAELELIEARIQLAVAADDRAARLAGIRDKVAVKEQIRDLTKVLVEGGKASARESVAADVEVTEARAQLAEAEGVAAVVKARLQDLITYREEERKLVAATVEAGREPPSALDAVDAKLAEAKARLAKAQSADPPPKK